MVETFKYFKCKVNQVIENVDKNIEASYLNREDKDRFYKEFKQDMDKVLKKRNFLIEIHSHKDFDFWKFADTYTKLKQMQATKKKKNKSKYGVEEDAIMYAFAEALN